MILGLENARLKLFDALWVRHIDPLELIFDLFEMILQLSLVPVCLSQLIAHALKDLLVFILSLLDFGPLRRNLYLLVTGLFLVFVDLGLNFVSLIILLVFESGHRFIQLGLPLLEIVDEICFDFELLASIFELLKLVLESVQFRLQPVWLLLFDQFGVALVDLLYLGQAAVGEAITGQSDID